MKKLSVQVTGMTCAACSSAVERAVGKIAGMEQVQVNLLANSMHLLYDEGVFPAEKDALAAIRLAVEKAGYGLGAVLSQPKGGTPAQNGASGSAATCSASSCSASSCPAENCSRSAPQDATPDSAAAEPTLLADTQSRELRNRFFSSLVFLAPLMYLSMFDSHVPSLASAFLQFLLVIPILFVNRAIFASGFKSLKALHPNMNALVALGATASLLYSLVTLALTLVKLENAYTSVQGLTSALNAMETALLDGGADIMVNAATGHTASEMAHHSFGAMNMTGIFGSQFYFEGAGTILTIITLGKWLESLGKKKTGSAIARLVQLTPKTAVVLVDINGHEMEKEVDARTVAIGDHVLVKPGTSVPVDGTVLGGESSVDESSLTGESIPVHKAAGDTVKAATLNQNGVLTIRADAVGSDTAFSRIISLVAEAASGKAPVARVADTVALYFVPAVIVIALITFAGWLIAGSPLNFALSAAVSVLVISCPCALGLATPLAIMVGTGKGAENGILVRSGEALETLSKIDTVVLDKTGTVTKGEPEVIAILTHTDVSEHKETAFSEQLELLTLAYTLEKNATHPLAQAVVRYTVDQNERQADPRTPPLENAFSDGEELLKTVSGFETIGGRGVQAMINGDEIAGGNEAFIKEKLSGAESTATLKQGEPLAEGTAVPATEKDIALFETVRAYAENGHTPLYFSKNGRLLGALLVSDPIRETSKEAIARLKKDGKDVVLLTGDNEKTARAVANAAGISEVVAGVLPDGKESVVRALQEKGRTVCMVGDGINDSPALTRADVGIAIGNGTDTAIESADVILVRNDLCDAATALTLGKKVLKNIKQNLFWAFFYNALCIPLAAGLYYKPFGILLNPMFASAAMGLSSLFVVSNALRLNFFKVKHGKREEAATTEAATSAVPGNNTKPHKEKKMAKTIELSVEGMMCEHCKGRVEKALNGIAGVSASVNLEAKTATCTVSDDAVTDETLTKAVTDAGYEVVAVK